MRRMAAFYPLVFMVVGLVFLLVAEHEMQRRISSDSTELRQDLQEAGVSRPEIAVLMSVHAKIEANAIAFTTSAWFINLIFAAMMTIPLYARLREEPHTA